MFTGLIRATGQVVYRAGSRLEIQIPDEAWGDPISLGESISINGCCLTVASADRHLFFDISDETLQRTTLSVFTAGTAVNLERALRPIDRMGGHFVQGHVDGVGELISRNGESFRFQVPIGGEKFLIDKGSIAIDGVSLTVVEPKGPVFEVSVIPETLTRTNLGQMQPGTKVNVEYDVLAKYVERFIRR